MILKKYENYLSILFFKNILIVSVVFLFLSFFLNIFEEIKYLEDKKTEFYYPILLTILNEEPKCASAIFKACVSFSESC